MMAAPPRQPAPSLHPDLMTLRFASARHIFVLIIALGMVSTHVQAAKVIKQRSAPLPVMDESGTDDELATAPPMPALSPTQAYRPLNFYNRTELLGFPADMRPRVKPGCDGSYVAPPLPKLPGDENGLQSPVYVAADDMQLDEGGESQVAGNVEVRQGQNLMRADRAVITGGRERVLLSGHVYLQDPAMTIEAESADLALDGSDSNIVNTRYALHEAHIRGSAGAIRRENMYSVAIEDGAYTTCEPGHNTWALASKRIFLDQEAGWGSASHVRLQVQSVPVLYVPYITFPIDKRRRSGVMYPTFSFSDGNGTDVGVPYYFNLDPQYDLMLTPRWIEKRGVLAEAELRYLHGSPEHSSGRGTLDVGVIGNDSAYGDVSRHIVRFRHDGNPTPAWQLFADATRVSDNDYLKDLNTQLSVNRESHLVRVLQTRYNTETWQALARVQGWQTIDPTIAPVDEPYRRLPQLQISAATPPGKGPRYSGNAEFVYFDRSVVTAPAANPVGSRVRVEPAASWQLHGAAWQFEPAARLRYAGYLLDDNPATDTPAHAVPTLSLGSTLFLERTQRMQGQEWLQTLEPRIFMLYTPYENQDDAPLFDTAPLTFSYEQMFRDNRYSGGDRIGDAQQVTLALESRLLAPDGSEAVRIGIGQALYAADRRVQLTPLTPAETDSRSPLVANIAWRVDAQWSARAEGQWAASDGDFVRGNLRANWQDASFRTFNAGYRYDKAAIDQVELSGLYPVDARWNVVGRWLFDFDGARSLEALGGVEYESCCWRARVLARRTIDINNTTATLVPEQGIVFEIELKGLGSLGDQVSNELADTIPGYETRRQALR